MAMTFAEMLDAIMAETSISTSMKQFAQSDAGHVLFRQHGPAIAMFITGLDFGLEMTKRYGRPSDEEQFEVIHARGPAEYRFGGGSVA